MQHAGWIVVANSSEARVFVKPAPGTLKELGAFQHIPSRENNTGEPQTGDGASAWPATREKEAQAFAHRVAQYLRRNHLRGAFDKLMLVAPPEFLGHLRAEVEGVSALRKVEMEKVHKDWVRHDIRDLEAKIRAQPALNAWPMSENN